MQVQVESTGNLERRVTLSLPAGDVDSQVGGRLREIARTVRIKGFRPGKVPLSHLRRLFGRSTMAEIVQGVLGEVARDTLSNRGERAAAPPDYKLPEDQQQTEEILAGNADLTYMMTYEVLPKFDLADFKAIAVERPVIEVSENEVDSQLKQLAENARSFATKNGAADVGDRLTIAYEGSIDGNPFAGGKDDNAQVTIGDGRFIPGFSEQLVGLSTGDTKTITVTFPENYGAKHLAGKEASFDIKVKAVTAADPAIVNDELAQRLGLDSLDALKQTVREQIGEQYALAARQRLKRNVLDQLDTLHSFELPPAMVEQEFDSIWRQVSGEMVSSNRTFEEEGTTEDAARADYRKIAERRVRLGLVMSEIGDRAKLVITDEEVQRALAAQLRQFPGQEQAVTDYYRNNPDAIAALRAPIFEEKVLDYLLELIKVTDKPMTREQLLEDDGDPT